MSYFQRRLFQLNPQIHMGHGRKISFSLYTFRLYCCPSLAYTLHHCGHSYCRVFVSHEHLSHECGTNPRGVVVMESEWVHCLNFLDCLWTSGCNASFRVGWKQPMLHFLPPRWPQLSPELSLGIHVLYTRLCQCKWRGDTMSGGWHQFTCIYCVLRGCAYHIPYLLK